MIPTYRSRLRSEGLMLAGSGAIVSVLVLVVGDNATRGPWSTVVQLVIVAALMATLGARSVRGSMANARPLDPAAPGAGEPTPLWQHPLIVGGLALPFCLLGSWDAGLRVGGGCVLVGLAQAVVFERMAAREERRRGERFFRVPGSSLFTGTKLGTMP